MGNDTNLNIIPSGQAMTHQHAVVWIDHREARVLAFGAAGVDKQILRSKSDTPHLHHKANSIGAGKAPVDTEFFDRVARAIEGIGSILITGPSTAKGELVEHIHAGHPAVFKAIEGVETVDHPTDNELVKMARSHLKAADRIAGNA